MHLTVQAFTHNETVGSQYNDILGSLMPLFIPVSLVSFGCCINPCSKDQDRLDFRKIEGDGEVVYCAALFDGHGMSATVADLAQDNMLMHIEAELQQIGFNDLSEKVKTQVAWASGHAIQCVTACVFLPSQKPHIRVCVRAYEEVY